MTPKHTCTRKIQGSNKGWKMVSNGLPQPNGTSMSILESNQKVPGEFYAANNHGIFISTDSGETWRRFIAEWPKEIPTANCLGDNCQ